MRCTQKDKCFRSWKTTILWAWNVLGRIEIITIYSSIMPWMAIYPSFLNQMVSSKLIFGLILRLFYCRIVELKTCQVFQLPDCFNLGLFEISKSCPSRFKASKSGPKWKVVTLDGGLWYRKKNYVWCKWLLLQFGYIRDKLFIRKLCSLLHQWWIASSRWRGPCWNRVLRVARNANWQIILIFKWLVGIRSYFISTLHQ